MSEPLSPEFILRLQRQIGNRAVAHFLRRRAVDARPTQSVVPASVAWVETKELAIVPPSEAVRTAVMETKVEDVVTVPGVNPLPSPVWRRMMSWIAHRMGED